MYRRKPHFDVALVRRKRTGRIESEQFEFVREFLNIRHQGKQGETVEASDDTVYVFLDIDGMLCPKCSDDLAESSQGWAQGWAKAFDPQCLALFERVVLSHSHVRVVISSSWRKKHSLDGLRRMFNEAVAERVVGVTPELEPTTRHFRYNEVLLYFKQNRIPNPRWVAVEDDDEHFPAGSPVVLTDSETGFGEHSAGQLSLFLNPD